MKPASAALAALLIIVLLGIAGTPDYVVALEQENDALRAEVKRTALELKRARVAAMSCTDDSRYLEAHRIVARAE